MNPYLFIAKGDPNGCAFAGADDRGEFIERMRTWRESLEARGQFLGANALPAAHKRVELNEMTTAITDGLYAETKEAITGDFHIRAESLEAALEISKSCPVLRFDRLEVYALNDGGLK